MSIVLPLDQADPRVVGPYTLTGRLGGARTGPVFLATAPDGRPVVVKVVASELAGEPGFRARFLQVARAAQRVSTFSTAAVLDVNADAPRPYLVTEYIDGPTLAEAVRLRGPMPSVELGQLAGAVANALTMIHAAGIVHRNLTPDNVVLTATGIRVVGVGIAAGAAAGADTGAGAGSKWSAEVRQPVAAADAADAAAQIFRAGFTAPELLLGEPATSASDVYAWGGIVLFAATGRLAHGEGHPAEVAHRVLHEPPDLTGLDPVLGQFVASALATQAISRPSAQQVLATLSALSANTSSAPANFDDHRATVSQPTTAMTTARRRLRPALLLVPAALLLVVALLAVGYLVTRNDDGQGDNSRSPVAAPTPTPSASSSPSPAPSGSPRPFVQPTPLGVPLTGHTSWVRSVAFSPDGTTLATASGDRTVILWDVGDPGTPRQISQPLTGHTDGVRSVMFSPDGTTLATGSIDRTVILWDVSDRTAPTQIGQPLTGHTDAVRSVAFSPDGKTLASGSDDFTAILWDVSDRTAPHQIGQPLTGHTNWVYAVAFSPDGSVLATGSDDFTAILWDVSDRTAPRQIGQPLTGHTDWVNSLAFSPDGNVLATGSGDQTVILWDVSDPTTPRQVGAPLAGHAGPVRSETFSPDGTVLATSSDDETVILWDVADPAAPSRLGSPLTDPASSMYTIAISPDGTTLVAGCEDATVRLWDLGG